MTATEAITNNQFHEIQILLNVGADPKLKGGDDDDSALQNAIYMR